MNDMMRTLARAARTTLLSLVLPASFGLAAPATAQTPIDLTGDWILTVESPNGTGTRQVTFVQEENVLSGTISSTMATGPLGGHVVQEDGTVTFTASVSMGTGDFDIVYLCTFRNGELVDGIVDFGEYGEGTFTGVRKPDGTLR